MTHSSQRRGFEDRDSEVPGERLEKSGRGTDRPDPLNGTLGSEKEK